MNLTLQFVATLSLIGGISIGELLSTKLLGALKKSWQYLLEILMFVSIITLITTTITINEMTWIPLFYFAIGFLTIVFVRYLMSFGGFFSQHIEKKLLKKKDEKDYIIGLQKALKRRGFDKKTIKRIAKEVGFPKEKIDEVLSYLEK